MLKDQDNIKERFQNQTKARHLNPAKIKGKQDQNCTADNQEEQQRYYGIERGNRHVRRFKLLFRDGRIVSVPYAYLPLLSYDPDGVLTIRTSELDVLIKGRAIKKLTEWFSEEKVTWIKESTSGIDDGMSDVFIASIELLEKDDP